MKKAVSILILVFVFTFTAQAQRGAKKGDFEKMTSEQKATLKAKKLALKLDLTEVQQRQVKALIKKTIDDRKASKKKIDKKNAEERFKRQNMRLDKQLAFKKKMKRILNEKQYEKFEKMANHKMKKGKKMSKKKMMKKHRKMKKNQY